VLVGRRLTLERVRRRYLESIGRSYGSVTLGTSQPADVQRVLASVGGLGPKRDTGSRSRPGRRSFTSESCIRRRPR
jgi:hypothetical protein